MGRPPQEGARVAYARIFRRWLHSREEDSPSERVYRTANFPFRPSRGRAGLEIHPDGTFVAIGIGLADGQRARRGRWREEDGAIRVRYDDGRGAGAPDPRRRRRRAANRRRLRGDRAAV